MKNLPVSSAPVYHECAAAVYTAFHWKGLWPPHREVWEKRSECCSSSILCITRSWLDTVAWFNNFTSNCISFTQVAMQFITLYSYEDIVTANIDGSSGSVWRISPPSRKELIKELQSSPADMTLRLAWNFQRSVRVLQLPHRCYSSTDALGYIQIFDVVSILVCVLKGLGEGWNSGKHLWQALH